MVRIGSTAPAFSLPSAGGGRVTLKGLKGNPVVLYFYPKDDTSGCTTEAGEFHLRRTFVIGVDGRVMKIFEKVKPKGHAAEVLAVLEEGRV